MANDDEQRTTMVHALREEPGSYTRTLENGAEVIYTIRPVNDDFTAGWEYTTESRSARSKHEQRFSSHADALRYLQENFDTPLSHQEEW